jgi:hypothetical protein
MDGDPVDRGAKVLRGNKVPRDWYEGRQIHRGDIGCDLSDNERNVEGAKLSAFHSDMTSPEQVCNLIGSGTTHRLITRMKVGDIAEVRVRSANPIPVDTPSVVLDVVWDAAVMDGPDGEEVPDTRPGADGHVGITGLYHRPALASKLRKSLADQLAEIASRDAWILPKPE